MRLSRNRRELMTAQLVQVLRMSEVEAAVENGRRPYPAPGVLTELADGRGQ
jgi:hypothetical protein